MPKLHLLAFFALLALPAAALPERTWTLAKSKHFELYTQADPESVRPALLWFESLWAFFKLEDRPAIRVIAFRSRHEYQEYRLRPNADAYYIGLNDRDYIVLPTLNAGAFPLAAHEFAHLAAHASGLLLPLWLNEGLAGLYSTLQISDVRSEVGGDPQAGTQLLRKNWMPLLQLLNITAGDYPQATARSER